MSIFERKGRLPCIEEMIEEWTLFLTQEEYFNNPTVKHNVDCRLNGYIDKDDFFNRIKPFNGFEDFLQALKKNIKN